jgi:hypothetical protein
VPLADSRPGVGVPLCQHLQVARTVVVAPLRPELAGDYDEWVAQVRARRAEFARSRRAAGIESHVSWRAPRMGVTVTRIEAASLTGAAQHLASSEDPFDRWYVAAETRLLGAPVLDPRRAPAELVAGYRTEGEAGLDLFVCFTAPLLEGKRQEFCDRIEDGFHDASGRARVARWGLTRLDIWLQEVAGRSWAVYDAAGDLSRMLTDLSFGDDPEMRGQRAFLREVFGLDLGDEPVPLPLAGVSWSG